MEVFGQRVEPGQLVHADKHGFIAIPKGWLLSLLRSTTLVAKIVSDIMIWYLLKGEEKGLLDASQFMDRCLYFFNTWEVTLQNGLANLTNLLSFCTEQIHHYVSKAEFICI